MAKKNLDVVDTSILDEGTDTDADELFEGGEVMQASGGLDEEEDIIGGLEEDDEVIDVSDFPDTYQDEIWPKKKYKGLCTAYEHTLSKKGDKMHHWEFTVRNPNAVRVQSKKLHLYVVRNESNKFREKAAIKAVAPDAGPFKPSQGTSIFVGRPVWVEVDQETDNRPEMKGAKRNKVAALYPFNDDGFGDD